MVHIARHCGARRRSHLWPDAVAASRDRQRGGGPRRAIYHPASCYHNAAVRLRAVTGSREQDECAHVCIRGVESDRVGTAQSERERVRLVDSLGLTFVTASSFWSALCVSDAGRRLIEQLYTFSVVAMLRSQQTVRRTIQSQRRAQRRQRAAPATEKDIEGEKRGDLPNLAIALDTEDH